MHTTTIESTPHPRPKRLHIVGCPRSGTTLMMELMASCFSNDGDCEHETSIFSPHPEDAQLYFSKKPTDIRYIKKILLNDPDLFIICLYRDPRSVITSIHKSKSNMYFVDYVEWKKCQDAAEALQQEPRFLLIKYEDLTQSPNVVQDRIISTFPFLHKKHAFTNYTDVAKPSEKSQNALNGVRPIDTTRHASWKKHLPRIKSQCLRHPKLLQDLIRLGYETDDSWFKELDSVEAKVYPCRYSKGRSPSRKWETHIRKYFQIRKYLKIKSKQ